MNNIRKYSLYFAFAALVLASLACQAVQGSSPTSVPEDPSSSGQTNPVVPTFPPVPTRETPVQTGGAYDGEWTGKNTVDDKEILFKVENNQITSIGLNYTGETSGCTYHGAISTFVDPAAAITDDGFSFVSSNNNDTLTFSGTFISDGEANGKLHIKSSSSGLCGEFEKEITWTANKGSNVEAEATEDTSGTISEGDSVAVLNQIFDAVNAGDVDSAIALVDDGIMFSIGSKTLFDSGELKSYLQSSQGTTYEISDIQSFGGTVISFKAKSSDGTIYSTCQAFVQDGKITLVSMIQ